MCIEMFPKNKINLLYRLLCLVCYIGVIIAVNSTTTLIVLIVVYGLFALSERSFRNIELIILTLFILWISYLLGNYLFLKITLIIDYIIYFLDTSYYEIDEELKVSEKDYIRFKNNKKKKKGSNDILAVYITVHLVILFVAIVVG